MGKFMGAGEITVAKRNSVTGFPSGLFRSFGCVDIFDPKFTISRGQPHVERCSGDALIDAPGVVKERGGTLDLSFTEWNIKNIALMLGATIVDEASPAVAVAETLPAGVVDGDVWHLGMATGTSRHKITGLVLNEDGSPLGADLVLNTNYTLDADYGTIKFIDVAGKTQPFATNAYGYTDREAAVIFNASEDEYIIRVNSKNVEQSKAKGIVELYRGRFNIIGSFPLIADDRTTFALTAELFGDSEREVDATYGRFGRVIPDLS